MRSAKLKVLVDFLPSQPRIGLVSGIFLLNCLAYILRPHGRKQNAYSGRDLQVPGIQIIVSRLVAVKY